MNRTGEDHLLSLRMARTERTVELEVVGVVHERTADQHQNSLEKNRKIEGYSKEILEKKWTNKAKNYDYIKYK